MHKSFCTVDENSDTSPPPSAAQSGNEELHALLVRQTLTRATHARVLKLKALVRTLSIHHEMLTEEIADALACSSSAVRTYIRELQNIHVVEIARHIPHRAVEHGRPVYRLGKNKQAAEAVLSWRAVEPKKKQRIFPSPAVIGNGVVHILEDDIPHNYQPFKTKHRRDPLVAALFGEVPA